METETLKIILAFVGAMVTIVLLQFALPIVQSKLSKRNSNGNGNSYTSVTEKTAGERSTEFWELTFTRIMAENNKPTIELLSQMARLLHEIHLTQKELVRLQQRQAE